jgi:hypothetical protein
MVNPLFGLSLHILLYLEIIINVCTFLINNVSGDIATDCIGGSFSGNFHNCDGKDITEKQQTSVTIKDIIYIKIQLACLYIYNIQILYRFFSISLDKTSRYCG